jgi:hypothetical protein
MDLKLDFPTQYKEPQLCVTSAKVLSQDNSKLVGLVGLVLQGEKKTLFFTSNAIFLQSMWSIFFEILSTYYFNGPRQDLMVESQKIKINLYNLHQKW